LTHVLKDTLGGNSRVTFLCSISSEHRYVRFLSRMMPFTFEFFIFWG
jgi:hypothetical protein